MSWQAWVAFLFATLGMLILLVGLVGATLSRRRNGKRSSESEITTFIGSVGIVVALLFLVLGSFTIVGTRQVGIETVFGRPNGETLSNGLHFKQPWANVNEMDGAIQIDQHVGDNRIKVRLGNSSTADADVSIRWQIKQEAADDLFVQYKTFDNVRTNLITRNLQVALNEVFASFDPLAPQNLDVSPLPNLAQKALVLLREKVGDQVEILDVAVPTIDYDDGTEAKINQLNQERAATAVAIQAQKTADEQAKANAKLAASVSNDPNVLVSKCLDIAKEKGLQLNCWPLNGVTPVVPVR